MVSCGRGCDSHWDVRCCCEPDCHAKNTLEQFRNCPMMVSTMLFHISNNYNWYRASERGDWSFLDRFRFSESAINDIKAAYYEEQMEGVINEMRFHLSNINELVSKTRRAYRPSD